MYCTKCRTSNPDDTTFCSGCGLQIGFRASPIFETLWAPFAGFWRRFLAIAIDSIVLVLGGVLLGFVFGFVFAASTRAMGSNMLAISLMGQFLGIAMYWLYFTLFESSSMRATPGKMALGIAVVDSKGRQISFARANGRYWGKILSTFTFGIGYLMVGFTQRKQGLHDLIADTLVVKKVELEQPHLGLQDNRDAPRFIKGNGGSSASAFRNREGYLAWRAERLGRSSLGVVAGTGELQRQEPHGKLPYEPLELQARLPYEPLELQE